MLLQPLAGSTRCQLELELELVPIKPSVPVGFICRLTCFIVKITINGYFFQDALKCGWLMKKGGGTTTLSR